MTIGAFTQSVSRIPALLKEANLFREKGVKPLGSVSDEFRAASQKGRYFEIYKTALDNLDYDFLLYDESFFQFSFSDSGVAGYPNLRFAFFQNPHEYVTYEEFLAEILETDYITAGDIFLEEYSQFLSEMENNQNYATIRYDLDQKSYHALIHSTSHLHIGNSENIRIPCNKVMTPLMFVLFVVKHAYFNHWKNLIENYEHFEQNYFGGAKATCNLVESPYWEQNPEEFEFFLT